MHIKCRKIVGGSEAGETLVTTQAINFLTMIDLKSGVVKDRKHQLYGKSIAKKILVFPNAIGSTVSAYSVYALKINDVAPRAIICNKADITIASGCAIANIPLADQADADIFVIKSGTEVKLDKNTIEVC
ncbi:MAG: aconitase X swivel domain-containing protein [Nitrososphaerales archaeon]